MIRLAVRVPRDQAEIVLAELLELAPAGVEEVALGEGAVEYAVYGAPGELPRLPDVRALAGGAVVDVSTREIPDDWHERWRRFHRPVLVAAPAGADASVPSLHVRPPWSPAHEAAGRAQVAEIVIDPGQAFGTGAHASTRLCLRLLLALATEDPRRGPVLDAGTGSGVLAIACALLGFAPVLGLDNELESVHAAAENAARNGVVLETRRLDLRSERLPDPAPGAPARLLTANLLRPLLLALAAAMAGAPEHLIAGGLLTHEADEVAQAFAALGMREHARLAEGEWAALWLRRG